MYGHPFGLGRAHNLGEYTEEERRKIAAQNALIQQYQELQTAVARARAHMGREKSILDESYMYGYSRGFRQGEDDAHAGIPHRVFDFVKSLVVEAPRAVTMSGGYTDEQKRNIAEWESYIDRYKQWLMRLPQMQKNAEDDGFRDGYNEAYISVSQSKSQSSSPVIGPIISQQSKPSLQPLAPMNLTAQTTPYIPNAPLQVLSPPSLAPAVIPYEGGGSVAPVMPAPIAPYTPPPRDASETYDFSRENAPGLGPNPHLFNPPPVSPPGGKTPEEIAIEQAAARAAASIPSTGTATPASNKLWWVIGVAVLGGAGYYVYKNKETLFSR